MIRRHLPTQQLAFVFLLTLASLFWSAKGLGQVTTKTFTSGSDVDYTVPTGVTTIIVEVWGGGGGGGGSNTNNSGGSGGGAGGYSMAIFNVTGGETGTYTVGGGGAGGTSNGNGGSGTASQFVFGETTLSANGGTGGVRNAGNVGRGGTASGGTANLPGMDGERGGMRGGNGGDSPNGGTGGTGGLNDVGSNGSAPGGGGGGGERGPGNNSRAGGAGARGQITITEINTTTTYYSYQAGNWNNANTWTTDPSGSLQHNPGVPTSSSRVVILNGRDVTVTNNNAQSAMLEIQDGATLDAGARTGLNFGLISGQGRLSSSSATLPQGNYGLFTQSGGGIIELYGDINNQSISEPAFNNLEINLNNGRSVNFNKSSQINGNLLISKGTLNISSPAGSSITVDGNITVNSGATLGMGSSPNTYERDLYVLGDFENYGTVTLTSNTQGYSNPTRGVRLNFINGTKDQNFAVNGSTVLDRLIVDKGTDDTYMLDVNASNTDYFKLYGDNSQEASNQNSPGDVINDKALEILAGTLRLGSNILIPRLLTQGSNANKLYTIDQDATLILDGADVAVTSQTNSSTIVVYGKLIIQGNSKFTSNGSQGIILREYGTLEIGGNAEVTAPVFRTSSRLELGTHRGTFKMSGGTFNINGYTFSNQHPSFALPFPDNTFQFTGGTINVNASNNSTTESWLVASNPDNITVTGGTVTISATTRNARINSTAPFYNLILSGSTNRTVSIEAVPQRTDASNTVVPAASRRPLVVLNNLTINTITFNPQNENVSVGGNFTQTGTYTPGTNTTTFNGFSIQTYTNSGTITAGGLYDMVLDNSSNLIITNNLTVRNDLSINPQTTLRDGGHTINVAGNIVNSGTHQSETGGSLTLNGSENQIIDGDGYGRFGNLTLNKSGGNTTSNAHISLDGNLRLAGNWAQFHIGKNRLGLSESSSIYSGLTGTNSERADFNENRMVITSGNQSDNGIEKAWNSMGNFTYPIGVEGKYTPAIIEIDGEPDTWGKLSINPANGPHPLATDTHILQYYWNLRRDEMTGIPSGNLRLKLYYQDSDVNSSDDDSNFRPARYFPPQWNFYTGSSGTVTTLSNEILFRNLPDPRGHFTAGEESGFGDVTTYYSRTTGNWNQADSWSTDPSGTPVATQLPGNFSPVFIQDNHTITISDNNILVGSLNIDEEGVLDIGTTTGHFFGMVHESTVTGNGRLRISSNTTTAQFPGGDFGEFLGENGGTVEYYTTGTQDYTLPKGNAQPLVILNESFESSVPPAGWSAININASNSWSRSATQSRTGSFSAYHPAGGGNSTTTSLLITPAIDMSDAASYQLTFYRYNSDPVRYTYQGVWISTTNANNRNQFSELVELGQGSNSWQQHTIDLSDYVGEQTVYVAFVYRRRNVGGASDNVYIDDVTISKTKGELPYHNLVINPDNNQIIRLPGIDVTTSGKTTITGNGTVLTSSEAATALTIQDSLLITAGATLRFENTRPFRLEPKGTMTIESGGTIGINNTGSGQEHRLVLHSDAVNNGTLSLRPNNSRYADIYFMGTADQTFSGTGTATLHRVYVNKGNSQTPMVDVTADSFDLNGSLPQALFIENGTIRFSGTGLTTTLSTNSTFGIPATGRLSINGATITVGNANSNDADLMLTGKVEVLDGTLNIGPETGSSNNDIEYATGGNPEIVVEGGILNVYGQIRRSPLIATGNLNYFQSGGDVYLHGRNREIGRALLEILNDGHFSMTGGDLHLVRGATSATQSGNAFGELYLVPKTHDVTGGTINVGTSDTPSRSNHFNLYLSSPVYNITVNGETNAKTAYLRSHHANIKGSLTIDGPAASVFNAGALDVNIGGDFLSYSSFAGNAYVADLNQTLRMNGTRNIQYFNSSGSSTIQPRNFIISNTNPSGIIRIAGTQSIVIRQNLLIESGELNLDRSLSVQGDVYNYGVKSSNNGNAVLILNGTDIQKIDGKDGAKFGRIRFSRSVVFKSMISFIVENDIRFHVEHAFLNMGEHNLTLGENATISAANENRYIITDGTIADGGVTKRYPASGGNFTFPVGVDGKYTPATIHISNTGGAAGAVTVKPVNKAHPSTTNDLVDELQYFWEVTSTGFGANPTVNHTYHYLQSDVVGTETQYVNARYIDYIWFSHTQEMDYDNNQILFTGVDYIDGDYTAGINQLPDLNFGIIHKYYSRTSGNWFTPNSWVLDSPSGPPATVSPRGNPIFIQSGHTITINNNGAFAGSVRIEENARLQVGQTLQHDIGHLRGGGTIAVTSQPGGSFVFPGGEYTEFMSHSTSTVEYTGAGTLPTNLKTYQNVKFLGTATKSIPAIDLLVLGNLTIEAGVLNNQNNRTIRMEGDWINNAANGFIPGTGTVNFQGIKEQALTSAGGERFYNLTLNKTADTLTLNSPTTVTRFLRLNNGIVNTSATNLLTVDYAVPSAVVGGSANTYVNGPLQRMVNTGSNAVFPVGHNGRYGEISISQTISTGSQRYTAQYFNQEPQERNNLAAPLQIISDNEFWTFSGTNDPAANITLRWDAQSNIIPSTALDRQKLRIAQYEPPWTRVGQIVTDGGQWAGKVGTSTPVTLSTTPSEFTLALEQTASAQITSDDVEECNYEGIFFPVGYKVMGDAPLTVIFQVNGVNFRTVNGLAEGSHTVNFTYAELFAVAGVNEYEVTISSVTDRNGLSGIVLGSGVKLTLRPTPSPLISGPTSVMTNSTSNFSVTPVDGDQYLWSVSALGIIQGSATGSTIAVEWGSSTGTDVITLIQSNEHCSTTVTYEVEVRDWPVITGNFEVCANSTEEYATREMPGHTYIWEVIAGTIISGNHTHEITINWSNQTLGRITLTQGEPGNTTTISQDVVINDSPTASLIIGNNGNVCDGQGALLTFGNTQAGAMPDYYLELDGNPVADYNSLPLPRPNPYTTDPFTWIEGGNNTYTFSVRVTNSTTGCESTMVSETVTVIPSPKKPVVSTAGFCFGATETVNVEVPFSEVGVTYEIFRVSDNESLSDPIPGNGTTIQIPVDITEPTTCYVLASNEHCEVMSDEFDIDYFQSPIISAITLDPDTICNGETAELEIEYEVFTPNFTFIINQIDILNNHVEIFNEDETGVGASPFTTTISPAWDSSTDIPTTVYGYQVVITDGNGCTETFGGTLPSITIWKVPQTGPPYHIPNMHTP